MNQSNLLVLFNSVSNAIEDLQITRGDWDGDDAPDNRTAEEIKIHDYLNELWSCIRSHHLFTEQSMDDIEYPSLPATDVLPVDMDIINRNGLKSFLAISKISKQDFAANYNCSPSYLSRILSGQKPVAIEPFVLAVQKLGYIASIDIQKQRWFFKK